MPAPVSRDHESEKAIEAYLLTIRTRCGAFFIAALNGYRRAIATDVAPTF